MYVSLKQPRGDEERYVTPARAAAEATISQEKPGFCLFHFRSYDLVAVMR